MAVVLSAKELHKHYRTGTECVRALDGLSLDIHRGQFIAIMGASGSGKSTFLHLAGGLDVATSGSIEIEGHDLARMGDHERTLFRRQRLGIVFQQFNLLPNLTAEENIALPMLVDGRPLSQIRSKVAELVHTVDLDGRAQHRPQAMSGGEQQRVAIARALMNDPALLLADEPTGNLDSQHAVEIWELLKELSASHGKTVVIVTHEAAGAAYAEKICVLRDGTLLGTIDSEGRQDAALVAHRYQELTQ